jgi:four helix bundle protein
MTSLRTWTRRWERHRDKGIQGQRDRVAEGTGLVRTYRDLVVWQKAYDLSLAVYRATRDFPKDEVYGLRSQMRRSAVSIPSNIAEGYGRRTTAEYTRSLNIAYGSRCELETQLSIAADLGYISRPVATKLGQQAGEVERMLTALRRALARRSSVSLDPSIPLSLDPSTRKRGQ